MVKVWLDKLLASAEDPREVFNFAHRRQLELLNQVRQAHARVTEANERIESKIVDAAERLPALEERAKSAITAGREDLARFALQLRQIAVDELAGLKDQADKLEQEGHTLELVEERLSAQIDAFFARQELLEARYTTAEAQVRINEALGGVSEELAGLGTALEEAEQSTEDMQARVSAIERLVELGVLEAPGGAEAVLGELDVARDSTEVEERLAALKSEVVDDDG